MRRRAGCVGCAAAVRDGAGGVGGGGLERRTSGEIDWKRLASYGRWVHCHSRLGSLICRTKGAGRSSAPPPGIA